MTTHRSRLEDAPLPANWWEVEVYMDAHPFTRLVWEAPTVGMADGEVYDFESSAPLLASFLRLTGDKMGELHVHLHMN